MSRIQEILSKAERDGTARRTRAFAEPAPQSTGAASISAPAPLEAVRPNAFDDSTPASPGAIDPRLVAALAPHSLAGEQYRSLRTRIKQAGNGRSLRVIAVTSPAKGDGKSLTAANLALTMAQEFNQRVLLMDGDMRRPTVHTLFGVAPSPGLSDVLMGAADINQALVTVPEYHLTLLPSGPPPGHPAELLGSSAMRRVLDTLRTKFDRILVDMTPVQPLADLHVLAPMVDGLLMIVRAGVTPKPAIEHALSGLDLTKVLGLVLNETGGDTTSRFNYNGYGYIAG